MSDLNFFSQQLNTVRMTNRKTIILLTVIAGIIILISGIYAVTEIAVIGLKTDIKRNQDYLNSPEVANGKKELRDKKNQLDVLKQYDTAVSGLLANIDDSDKVRSKLIETIDITLPSGVEINNLTINQQNVSMTATAPGRLEIAEMEHNLLETGLFEKVHVDVVTSGTDKKIYSFNVKCLLKEVVAK